MILVEHIQKQYGQKQAVHDVSFSVEKGNILGFVGPNGAGKTTTMKMLLGLIAPTGGKANIGGFDIVQNSKKVRSIVGYLAENNPLYDSMRVYEFLLFMAKAKGTAKVKDEIRRVIAATDIQAKIDSSIFELSKGYRQRVGLAAALLNHPPYLILDEPSSGLDPKQAKQIRELIKSLSQDSTVIFSSHILSEVQAIADHIVIINNGKVVVSGAIDEIEKKVQGNITYKIVIEGPTEIIAQKIGALSSIVSMESSVHGNEIECIVTCSSVDIRRAVYDLCTKEGWILLEQELKRETLESIFFDAIKTT